MPDLHDPRGLWVKVCGLTRPQDVEVAVDAGASAVGFVFAASPRQVTAEEAAALRRGVPEGVRAVGVFGPEEAGQVRAVVDEAGLDAVQMLTMAPPLPAGTLVLRTVRVRSADDLIALGTVPCDAIHVDAFVEGVLGGTGVQAPWEVLRAYRPRKPFVLSGGLGPSNVAEAVAATRPHGVDASSGLEAEPRVKDHDKVRAFVAAARGAQA